MADTVPEDSQPAASYQSVGCAEAGRPWPSWAKYVAYALTALVLAAGGGYGGYQWWSVHRHVRAARAALVAGDFDSALASLQIAEQASPNNAEVVFLQAVASRRSGQVSAYEGLIERAAELGCAPDEIDRQRWLLLLQRGDYAAGGAKVLETIEQGASDEEAEELYEAVAKGHLTAFRLEEAWKCLDIWLQWRPDAPWARFMRATIYERLDEFSPAIGDYQAALGALPENRAIRLGLGHALIAAQRMAEARDVFSAGVELRPDDADCLLYAAQCEREFGNQAKAGELLDRIDASRLDRDLQSVYLSERGWLLLAAGKPQEALDAFSRAVALDPTDHATLRALATALARTGHADRVRAVEERMRRLDRVRARMRELSRHLSSKPGDADARFEMATLLVQLGKPDEGLRWLATALSCNPGHRPSHLALAEYYVSRGDMQRAAEHRLRAAQGGPSTGSAAPNPPPGNVTPAKPQATAKQ